tara:strand:+ start:1676 stop:1843 length:168 start_codon:yes stop_codon:yes gene_type:complete
MEVRIYGEGEARTEVYSCPLKVSRDTLETIANQLKTKSDWLRIPHESRILSYSYE